MQITLTGIDGKPVEINKDDVDGYGAQEVKGKQENFVMVKGVKIYVVEDYSELPKGK